MVQKDVMNHFKSWRRNMMLLSISRVMSLS
uniref:3-deoxy-manno-octulosonate cytidylyltransferase-like n=1 Tax=Rhizophora mucronata TaxID=61149 RepID=A0A2P2KC05_RHIMU